MKNKSSKLQENCQKGDDKRSEYDKNLIYYLENIHGIRKKILISIIEIILFFEKNSKKLASFLVIIVTTVILNFMTKVTAGMSLFETILNWNTDAFVTNVLSKNSSKELSLNYTETGTYKEFKDVENRLNVELLKLNYIPDRFKFEKITVAEDESSTNFRISAIYSDKNDNTSLIYNAYVGRNASVNLQVIQEKMQENPIIGHFKLNNIDIPYNIFENTNWYSVTWSYNNIVYELYGIKSKDELIKVIDNVSLKIN